MMFENWYPHQISHHKIVYFQQIHMLLFYQLFQCVYDELAH